MDENESYNKVMTLFHIYINMCKTNEFNKNSDYFRSSTKFIFEIIQKLFITEELIYEMTEPVEGEGDKTDKLLFAEFMINLNNILENIDTMDFSNEIINENNIIDNSIYNIVKYFEHLEEGMNKLSSSMNEMCQKLDTLNTVFSNMLSE